MYGIGRISISPDIFHDRLCYNATANDHFSVKMGTHLTVPANTADSIVGIPMDNDLNTDASPTGAYAPCVSCHDPHGTSPLIPPTMDHPESNAMLRYKYTRDSNELCSKCKK